MKKTICLIMAILLILGMVACSAKPDNNVEETVDNAPEATLPEETQNDTVEEEPEDKAEENLLKVPSKEIYFTCPEGWFFGEETYSTVLSKTDECLVAVCYNWAIPYEGNLEGLVDFFGAGVMRDVAPYSKGYLGAATISATTTEKATVAGFDCVKFTGTAPNSEWDCHVYGYTMIVNEIPMMVLGLVSTQAQDAQMIAEIDALTDQIAASIRTEK